MSDGLADGARCLVVDPWDRWADPEREAHEFVRADPDPVRRGGGPPGHRPWPADPTGRRPVVVAGRLAGGRGPGPGRHGAVRDPVRGRERPLGSGLTEPSLAHRLFAALPDGATLVVSSSMPVRDIECFAGPRPDAAPGAGQPGRQRHRRCGVHGPRGGPGRRTARPWPWSATWPSSTTSSALVGSGGGRARSHRGGGRQRRGRDLLVPAPRRGPRPGHLRHPVRHPAGARSGGGGGRVRLAGRRRGPEAGAGRAGGRRWPAGWGPGAGRWSGSGCPTGRPTSTTTREVNAAIVDAVDRTGASELERDGTTGPRCADRPGRRGRQARPRAQQGRGSNEGMSDGTGVVVAGWTSSTPVGRW